MKQILLFSGILVGMIAAAGSATGNPISCEAFRVRQVPNSTHVQITFANICSPHQDIESLSRDSDPLDPDWEPFDDYTANLGSGLTTVPADQTCDCDVALGDHRYEITLADMSMALSVTVVDPQTMSTDETASDESTEGESDTEEVMPWDIPEPEEIQGLDCNAACDSGGPSTRFPHITIEFPDCAVTAPGAGTAYTWPVLLLLAGLPIWLIKKSRKRHH